MDPLGPGAAAGDALGRRGGVGGGAGLQDQPLGVGGEVVDAGRAGLVPLVDGSGIDGDGLPQKLGDVRPGEGAENIAAKKGSGSDLSAGNRPWKAERRLRS